LTLEVGDVASDLDFEANNEILIPAYPICHKEFVLEAPIVETISIVQEIKDFFGLR